jgi:Sulfotransferase family
MHSYAVQRILDHYPYMKPPRVAVRLRYNTFVNLSKRYMYFGVPKAACTAMKWLLHRIEHQHRAIGWAFGETRRDMFIHDRKNLALASLVDLDDRTQREVLESPDFFRMTIVRNPYTRLISTWQSKVILCEPSVHYIYNEIRGGLPQPGDKAMISFHEFVEYLATRCDLRLSNHHWRRQVDHTFFSALNFFFVGKVEDLSEALRRFQQHLGRVDPLPFESSNTSVAFGQIGYDAPLAEMASSLYRQDFETFGYDPTVWPSAKENQRGSSDTNGISEARYRDEIIERNIIISQLYIERSRLRRLLKEKERLVGQPDEAARGDGQ